MASFHEFSCSGINVVIKMSVQSACTSAQASKYVLTMLVVTAVIVNQACG